MRLFAWFKRRDKKQDLEYAQEKLEGKPSPFREGAPEKAQAHSVDRTETRFIP